MVIKERIVQIWLNSLDIQYYVISGELCWFELIEVDGAAGSTGLPARSGNTLRDTVINVFHYRAEHTVGRNTLTNFDNLN